MNIVDYLSYLNETDVVVFTENLNTPITDNVINIEQDWDEVNRTYEKEKIVILDNFLNPEFANRLRHFKLSINRYHGMYDGGYVNLDYQRNGLWFPILEKLVQDCESYIPFLNVREFVRGWSFLYEYECEGVNIHSDYESVNLNMWVTPTESLLDLDTHNGLDIWKVYPPSDWDQDKSNSDEDSIFAFLQEMGVDSFKIKYAYNRAVLFDSKFFHKTQGARSLHEWKHKRINYTMMWK